MTKSPWRQQARRILNELAESNPDVTQKEMEQLIRDAYPWGPRAMHPYKIWLSERKRLLSELYGEKVAEVEPVSVRNYWVQS